ncbi:hypothetical protein EV421DRAFT_1950738, partial [Armillaria borealis]
PTVLSLLKRISGNLLFLETLHLALLRTSGTPPETAMNLDIRTQTNSPSRGDHNLFEDAPDVQCVKKLINDAGLTTENMVEDARKMLEYFKECHQSIPTWLTNYNIKQGKFKLELVLTAMLDLAPMSGGPEREQTSLRYVAAAICACRGTHRESVGTADALSALAVT